ncbi:MAG TPA: lysophospholipid acyltransferase family protein [Pirellulales bacterium]|jgi:1-acyl-sn-glycerol-3-phosphate acyltransferase|nr:lysophospholipid acyltransferase family protein [Pirellulales bacterium]
MWNAIVDGAMPRFWPPRPSRFWNVALEPWRRWYLHRYYRIAEVAVDGAGDFERQFAPDDGVLLAPNHSHDSDPHVMMDLGRRLGRQLHFMAAWQIFRPHHGLDGWILQRMGAFSVDREGCDRRAIHQATEVLTTGRWLVVFPEGEVYRLNDRLTPLLDGVAFMALAAQRELSKTAEGRRVWIVPTAIRYRYVDDILPNLATAVERLERSLHLKPPHGATLDQRLLRYGEMLLTVREKEKLGRSFENEGDLACRLSRLTNALLERHETSYLKKSPSAETVALRVKALRRCLFEIWTDDGRDAEARRVAREALDDVQLALQAYSYPGNYVSEKPNVERMAETVEKLEEDLDGFALPKGRRRARIVFGEPIDLSQAGGGRPRAVAEQVTDRLETAIQQLMSKEE